MVKRIVAFSIFTFAIVVYGKSSLEKTVNTSGSETFYGYIDFVKSETSCLNNPMLNEKKNLASAVIRRGSKDGEIVTDAVISINSKNLSFNSYAKNYVAMMPDAVPGAIYRISITIGKFMYTDSIMFPGGISISSDGASVSWAHSGSLNQLLTMTNVNGKGTNVWEKVETTSPVTVPPQAYLPVGNIVTLRVLCQNNVTIRQPAFSGISIQVKDIKFSDYQK